MTVGFAPAALNQAPPGIYIDPILFYSSIPHHLNLGQSYTLKALVVNNSPEHISGFVLLDFSPDYFFTSTPIKAFNLVPGESQLLTFPIVPTNLHSIPIAISALLYALLTPGAYSPVQKLSTGVEAIVRSPLVNTIETYLVAGILAAGGLSLLFLFLRRTSSPKPSPLGTASYVH